MALFHRQADQLLDADQGMVHSADRFDAGTFSSLMPDVVAVLPTGSRVVERLLEIAQAANRVNLRLDRSVVTREVPAQTTALQAGGDLRTISDRCQSVETVLQGILGPLGSQTTS
jgi:hypothetical protein